MKTKAKLEKYRNSEFIQFLKDLVKIYKAFNLKTLKLDALIAEIETYITQLEELFAIAKKNENTELLENADLRRDRAIIGIRTLAVALENFFETDTETAAIVVVNIIDKYGTGIANYNYIKETNTISSIVNDFETDAKAMAAVSLLKISNWVGELKSANIEFNNIYLMRNKDTTSQPDQNLRDLRKPSTEKYSALIEKTKSYFNVTETQDYKTILDEIDTLVIKYNFGIPKPTKKTTPKPPQV